MCSVFHSPSQFILATALKGTVRSNLDPFDDFNDDDLLKMLERVGLYGSSRSNSNPSESSKPRNTVSRVTSLNDVVTEGGVNFSVGQRQLLVIARALLHGATIVVMDEATASVDAETDSAITEIMRREFERATVLTVAHRYDDILGGLQSFPRIRDVSRNSLAQIEQYHGQRLRPRHGGWCGERIRFSSNAPGETRWTVS